MRVRKALTTLLPRSVAANESEGIDDAGTGMGRTRKPAANSTAATVRKKPRRLPWLIIQAERDVSGEWLTTGEPLPNVAFGSEADAFAYSMKRHRQGNAKFDWADDPSVAWVAVRADALGRLRSHKPVGEAPPERLPVVAEPAVRLAPASRGRPRERDEEEEQDMHVQDDADDEDTDQDGTEDDEDGHPYEDEAGQDVAGARVGWRRIRRAPREANQSG